MHMRCYYESGVPRVPGRPWDIVPGTILGENAPEEPKVP